MVFKKTNKTQSIEELNRMHNEKWFINEWTKNLSKQIMFQIKINIKIAINVKKNILQKTDEWSIYQ